MKKSSAGIVLAIFGRYPSVMEPEFRKPLASALNVRRYTDLISYLRAYYKLRKHADASFSLEKWSAELGFKSDSFMYMVYHGKRQLTVAVVGILSRSFGFDSDERHHLGLLALHARSKSDEEREAHLDKILENIDIKEEPIKPEDKNLFLSAVDLPALRLILAYPDFSGQENDLAEILGLNPDVLKNHLRILENLGLAQRVMHNGKIHWKTLNKSFVVPSTQESAQSLKGFHQKTLQECGEILDQELPQRFRSLFFALPEEQFSELVTQMENFISKVKNTFGTGGLANKRLFKLNLQAYPVSRSYKK